MPIFVEDLQKMDQTIEMHAAPPYFVYGCDVDSIIPTFTTHDLSSPLKLKYEPEELVMQFNLTELENAISFDSKTGKKIKGFFNPVGSKYFIQTETGTTFTEEEIPELLKVIEHEFAERN